MNTFFPQVNDYESFQYFGALAVQNLKNGGLHSFIVPNTLVLNVLATGFRTWMLRNGSFLKLYDLSDIDVFHDPKVRAMIYVYEKTHAQKESDIHIAGPEGAGMKQSVTYDQLFTSRNWAEFLRAEKPVQRILAKVRRNSILLGEITESKQGYIPYRYTTLKKRFGEKAAKQIRDNREWHGRRKLSREYKRELQGKDVSRYLLDWSGAWVKYGRWVSTYVDMKFFCGPRLLFREITGPAPHSLIVSYSEQEFVNNPSIITAIKPDNGTDYSLLYCLSLANSTLTSVFFSNTAPKARKGLFPKIIVEDVRRIPIGLIEFTTPDALRRELGKNLESEYQASNFAEILRLTQECLPKDTKSKEKSDVVHDFLAFLARQMMGLNKKKHNEILGFLKHLERTIGTAVESLANKTLLKDYHQHSFEQVLGVLRRNRKRLQGFDPRLRSDQERLAKEFKKSVEKLAALGANIQATDRLIDQIVYKLYGLTDEDINIVEGE